MSSCLICRGFAVGIFATGMLVLATAGCEKKPDDPKQTHTITAPTRPSEETPKDAPTSTSPTSAEPADSLQGDLGTADFGEKKAAGS